MATSLFKGGATNDSFVSVPNQAAMLALPDRPGQQGLRADVPGYLFEQNASPASVLANWVAWPILTLPSTGFTYNLNAFSF